MTPAARSRSAAAAARLQPTTLGAPRASGHVHHSVKEEVRANLPPGSGRTRWRSWDSTAGRAASPWASWRRQSRTGCRGTNLHHALLIAGRFLRRHSGAEPVVIVVTYGEPTAHLDDGGEACFGWPPAYETLRRTVAEVDALTRYGATINTFMLGEDPRPAALRRRDRPAGRQAGAQRQRRAAR